MSAQPDRREILTVDGLTVVYDGDPPVHAVNDVSLTLHSGEILGVAGESGSGKSTLMNAVTRLERAPARIAGGRVLYTQPGGQQVDLTAATPGQLRRLRWERLAVVFQSAMNALNPVKRLGAQFVDTLREHRGMSRKPALARARELLEMVGIPPERVVNYPHELSGGQRQRSLIALALACEPDLIVMDEPTTAVDVVMQRQILQQIQRLQDELDFAVIFITHDLSLLVELADRIAIMYAGGVVEIGTAQQIYERPQHPYTLGLRNSFPPLRGPRRALEAMEGSPPNLRHLPSGCPFHPRCPRRFEPCDEVVPQLIEADHPVACLLHDPAYAPGATATPDENPAAETSVSV